MPTLTRWFIKSALVYLVASLFGGVLLALASPGSFVLAAFGPMWIHLLVVGWLTQLIFGVAYWMFPRASPEKPRGSSALGWLSFWSMNLGLLLRLGSEPLTILGHRARPALIASAALQFIGGWAFVANTWPRIRER